MNVTSQIVGMRHNHLITIFCITCGVRRAIYSPTCMPDLLHTHRMHASTILIQSVVIVYGSRSVCRYALTGFTVDEYLIQGGYSVPGVFGSIVTLTLIC